jgi:hypothetical protein
LPGSRDCSGKRNGSSKTFVYILFFQVSMFKKGITINIFCHCASWFVANLWLDHDIITLLNFGLRGIRMFLIYCSLFYMFKTYEQELLIREISVAFLEKVCPKSKPQAPVKSSVADPNPDPDPYVFGPPGSGSGSGSFYHQAKIVR